MLNSLLSMPTSSPVAVSTRCNCFVWWSLAFDALNTLVHTFLTDRCNNAPQLQYMSYGACNRTECCCMPHHCFTQWAHHNDTSLICCTCYQVLSALNTGLCWWLWAVSMIWAMPTFMASVIQLLQSSSCNAEVSQLQRTHWASHEERTLRSPKFQRCSINYLEQSPKYLHTANISSQQSALRLKTFCLCGPTHQRPIWERSLKTHSINVLTYLLDWLTDWVHVLHPIWHKIGHFGDILPSQSFGIVLKKLNLTKQKQTIQEQTRMWADAQRA